MITVRNFIQTALVVVALGFMLVAADIFVEVSR